MTGVSEGITEWTKIRMEIPEQQRITYPTIKIGTVEYRKRMMRNEARQIVRSKPIGPLCYFKEFKLIK